MTQSMVTLSEQDTFELDFAKNVNHGVLINLGRETLARDALSHIAILSELELRIATQYPHSAERCKWIVDGYTELAGRTMRGDFFV